VEKSYADADTISGMAPSTERGIEKFRALLLKRQKFPSSPPLYRHWSSTYKETVGGAPSRLRLMAFPCSTPTEALRAELYSYGEVMGLEANFELFSLYEPRDIKNFQFFSLYRLKVSSSYKETVGLEKILSSASYKSLGTWNNSKLSSVIKKPSARRVVLSCWS